MIAPLVFYELKYKLGCPAKAKYNSNCEFDGCSFRSNLTNIASFGASN